MIDDEGQEQREREERRAAKLAQQQHRADVQAVFGTPAGRRVLASFLADAGADISPLRADNLATGHAIGWADAAGWWLNQLRAHCPEREGQMRKETRDAAKPQDESDD